jgi:uncharacterized protein (DUF58 family)
VGGSPGPAPTPSSTTPAPPPSPSPNSPSSPATASACSPTAQGIQQRLLPGRGAAHLRQFIESLAQVRAEAGEADHLRATATLNRLQPRRALILWVTDLAETAMRPEVIDGAMQLLRRHVLLFVAMAQPEVESIAQARPKNVEQMFRAAAAQEMAGRRELLLARLHEHGALTLDLNPEALTSSVLNQYLMVKERAMV